MLLMNKYLSISEFDLSQQIIIERRSLNRTSANRARIWNGMVRLALDVTWAAFCFVIVSKYQSTIVSSPQESEIVGNMMGCEDFSSHNSAYNSWPNYSILDILFSRILLSVEYHLLRQRNVRGGSRVTVPPKEGYTPPPRPPLAIIGQKLTISAKVKERRK